MPGPVQPVESQTALRMLPEGRLVARQCRRGTPTEDLVTYAASRSTTTVIVAVAPAPNLMVTGCSPSILIGCSITT
jgi:hypothetical protein